MEAVIRVPLAPVRSEPSDRAEMVTQALFGERVDWMPVDGKENWVRVRLENDGYTGFMDPKLLGTDADSMAAFAGACVQLEAPLTRLDWAGTQLHLPAGSQVPSAALPDHVGPSDRSIVSVARQFLGAPYLWGGKSILGIDCSGLTQLTGQLCGLELPRDASQQWASSTEIREGFHNLQHGDLVFFHNPASESVTHVGIAIDSKDHGWQVLHASGEVRVDALDDMGIVRDGQHTHLWTGAAGWPLNAG